MPCLSYWRRWLAYIIYIIIQGAVVTRVHFILNHFLISQAYITKLEYECLQSLLTRRNSNKLEGKHWHLFWLLQMDRPNFSLLRINYPHFYFGLLANPIGLILGTTFFLQIFQMSQNIFFLENLSKLYRLSGIKLIFLIFFSDLLI